MAHMIYPHTERRRLEYLNACAFLNVVRDKATLELYDGGSHAPHTETVWNFLAFSAAVARRSLPLREQYYKLTGGGRATANLPQGPALLVDAGADDARYPRMAGDVLLGLLAQGRVECLGIPSVHTAALLMEVWAKRQESAFKSKGWSLKSIEASWHYCRAAAHLWAAATRHPSGDLFSSLFPTRNLRRFLARAEAYRQAVNALPRRAYAAAPVPDGVAWRSPRGLSLAAVEVRMPSMPDDWPAMLEEARRNERSKRRF